MPLFRRGPRPPRPVELTVGLNDHRVVVNGPDTGIAMLGELRGYVSAVTGGAASPTKEGRDPVAVLSAKMDYAELVNDACGVAALTLEEMVDRGVVTESEAPPQPDLPPVPQRASTYDYIQATHARAEERMRWLERVDALLRDRGVAILAPVPKEEAPVRPR